MEKKEKLPGSIDYYLCPGQRYKLSWIYSIDDEDIVLRTHYVFRDISFFTKSYQYIFKREEDDEDKDAAIFIKRIKLNESNSFWIKIMESPIQYGGRYYTYSEEKWCLKLGDYPRLEERTKRIREMVGFNQLYKEKK